MAATFPGGVKVFTTKQAGDQIASAHINDLQDEVVAVETELRKTSGSVVSHGSLAGLSNNDHPQYLLSASTNYPRADGWIPVSGTWTYASATTITVPSGAANIYSVGMGIRLTANGVVKQAYIIKVENTLLTIAGDELTNYTFSAIRYAPNPAAAIGFPQWFNWTPTLNTGAADLSGYTLARFCKVGKTTHIMFNAGDKSLSGSSGLIEIGLPDTPKYYSTIMLAKAYPIDGTYVFVECNAVNTGKMTVAKGTFGTPWTGNETGVYIYVSGFYETA